MHGKAGRRNCYSFEDRKEDLLLLQRQEGGTPILPGSKEGGTTTDVKTGRRNYYRCEERKEELLRM